MSKVSSIIPMCDNHTEDVAQTLCRCQRKLLCLSCALEKAKSPECSITEIQKVSGDKDTLLFELLLVRQIATRKEKLVEEHENKTRALRNKLDQDVIDTHVTLSKRLDEMKETCLTLIEKQAESLTAANSHDKQRLDTLKATLNEHIDKLSAASINDILQIQTKIKEIETEVMCSIPDKDSEPEGEFKRNERLGEIILQSRSSLGSVYLIDSERYEKIDDALDRTSIPAYLSSDEIIYDTEKKVKAPSVELVANSKRNDSVKESAEKESENHDRNQNSETSNRPEITSQDTTLQKWRKVISKWKLFSSDKKETRQLEENDKGEGRDLDTQRQEGKYPL